MSVGIEPRRGRPDEQELRVRMALAHELERFDQLWYALARIQVTEAAQSGVPSTFAGSRPAAGQAGCSIRQIGPR